MCPSPDRESVSDAPPSRALVERVEGILGRGGLVVMPTETVYGIGARADLPAALDALREAKGRPADLALTWHVGSADAIERFGPVGAPARRLAARYWPGPLTLVLPGVPEGLEGVQRDGWTGVRMPAHRATAGILERLPFPVVMSSANLHEAEPHVDADGVLEAFAGRGGVALVLDGGPARLGEPSCVLRLGRGRFELLREGLISLESLRSTAGLRLGFLCTGNTCRSPMAEGLARKRIAERLGIDPSRIAEFGFAVESMGMSAAHGQPASRLAVQVMEGEGVDLSDHRSRAALSRDLHAFDRIYCMTRGHKESLASMLPPGRDGHVELLDPQGGDIPDPIGGTREDYLDALRRIRAAIERRVTEWV